MGDVNRGELKVIMKQYLGAIYFLYKCVIRAWLTLQREKDNIGEKSFTFNFTMKKYTVTKNISRIDKHGSLNLPSLL